jgi:hypothetical protein
MTVSLLTAWQSVCVFRIPIANGTLVTNNLRASWIPRRAQASFGCLRLKYTLQQKQTSNHYAIIFV